MNDASPALLRETVVRREREPEARGLLESENPESAHVEDVDLRGAPDSRIWEHARENGFTIVSKDDDFRQRSFLHGAPPKVVWLQVENAGTEAIAELLRRQASQLRRFESEEDSVLAITRNRRNLII